MTTTAFDQDPDVSFFDKFKPKTGTNPELEQRLNVLRQRHKEKTGKELKDINLASEELLAEHGLHRPDGKSIQINPKSNVDPMDFDPDVAGIKAPSSVKQAMGLPVEQQSQVDLTKPYIRTPQIRSQQAIAQQQQFNPQDVVEAAKRTGQGLASLADVTVGGVLPATAGYVAQGLSSPFTSPQRAEQIGQKVSSTLEKPFGKTFGVTETPGYKGELSQQIMGGLGKAGEYTAEQIQEISKLVGTGISPENARYMVQTGMFFLPKGANIASKGLKAIGSELGDVKSQMAQQFQTRQQPQPQALPQSGLQSGGAAAVQHEQAVRQALTEARPDLQAQLANRPINTITPKDLQAIEIHNKFAKVDPEFVPTEGQATQDVAKLSDEYNQKTHEGNEALRAKFEERDPMLIKGFNNIKDEFAAEHSGVGQQGKANNILEHVKKNNVEVDNQNIKNAYTNLEQLNNGKFPLDAKKVAQNALEKLNEKDDIDFLPDTWKKRLDDYASGEKDLNLNKFEHLRTQLATAIRGESNGNIRNAIGHIKDALEELPLTDETAIEFKDAADTARGLFRRQKELLDTKKPTYNKLYSMAYEDNRTPLEIETGNVAHPASKGFFENFVTGNKTTPADLSRAIELLGRDTPAHHEIIAGLADHLKQKAGVIDDKGNISQAALNKELNKLGPNLDLIAGPEVANRLRNIGEVARLSEHVRNRAGGSANVSQSGILTETEAAKRAARDVAIGIGEAALNVKTGGASGVVGQVLKPMFKARQEKALLEAEKAQKALELQRRISPTAGITPIGTINIKGQP
jgi:hypothetical protein